MTRVLAAAAILILLAGLAAAEPQPVDSDWQRSDGVPAEIATRADAPPETAEAAEGEVQRVYDVIPNGAAVCCGLFALAVMIWWLWGRRS